MSTSAVGSRSVAQGADLRVERRGIRFWNVAPDRVRIEVLVENRGDARSEPDQLVLQSAVLGAFVPWRPLERLAVPALEPGGVAVVGCERRRPRVRAVADFSGLVPPRLWTALGTPDEGSERPAGEPPVFARGRGRVMPGLVDFLLRASAGSRELSPDVLELLGRGSPHWAGNINVMIGGRAVERHMAQALRVHPGRTNLAVFLLGGDAQGYVLRVRGSGAQWPHCLLDPGLRRTLEQPDGSHWYALGMGPSPRMVFFVCRPPAGCGDAAVEIHIERRPHGDQAVVELSLAPDAAGPGCYAV